MHDVYYWAVLSCVSFTFANVAALAVLYWRYRRGLGLESEALEAAFLPGDRDRSISLIHPAKRMSRSSGRLDRTRDLGNAGPRLLPSRSLLRLISHWLSRTPVEH